MKSKMKRTKKKKKYTKKKKKLFQHRSKGSKTAIDPNNNKKIKRTQTHESD